MKKSISLITCLFLSVCLFGQVVFETKKNALVSKAAFNKKTTAQFNYLILGENSPQQGISATLNEKKSNLKINGLLYSGVSGIYTIEADLAASNGVYFFDQENGSEQGKITLNYFNRLWSSSSFNSLRARDRALVNLQITELVAKAKSDFNNLKALMSDVKFYETPDYKEESDKQYNLDFNKKVKDKIRRIAREYINNDDDLGYDALDAEAPKFDKSVYFDKDKDTTTTDSIGPKDIRNIYIRKPDSLKLLKLIQEYDKATDFILNKLEDSINKIELKSSEKQWTWEKTLFLGVSPFYERQSFKRFTFDATKTFSDMFAQERGDVYGATFSLNFAMDKGQGNKSRFRPQTIFTRLSLTLNRASNISNFRNTTLEITGPIGNDVNGNPIVFTNNDKAFVGDSVYEFGFGRLLIWDGYIYPFEAPIGIFGSIGYEKISFNRGSPIEDKELYPMRLGVLFSLVNKDTKKPNITVQAFIDRSDLNLSPNGNDNDLRFGLGVGLPVNF